MSPNLSCHLLLADEEGTVTIKHSIDELEDIFGDQLQVQSFDGATHSIHSSAPDAYLEAIQSIVKNSVAQS